jgi:hypothetical protein
VSYFGGYFGGGGDSGSSSSSGSGTTTPVPAPLELDEVELIEHVAAALDRLPEQFRRRSSV